MAQRQTFHDLSGNADDRLSQLGEWSLASAPEQSVSGLVEWDPGEGWSLVLQGRLFDIASDTIGPILGVTVAGEEITLLNIYPKRDTDYSAGAVKRVEQRCGATVGFVGAHLPTSEDRSFAWGSFSFTHLNTWFNEFVQRMSKGVDGQTIWHDNHVDERETTWQRNRIVLDSGINSSRDFHSASVRRQTWFEAEAPEAMPFERWMRTFIQPLNDLLNIATLESNDIERLTFLIREDDRDGRAVPPTTIRCQYQDTRSRELHRHDLLFSIQDLPTEFESFFPLWLDLHERFRHVFTLGMAARYEGVGYLDNQFLNTVTAAEIFHRIKYPDHIDDPQEHTQRVSRIVEAAHQMDRAWLGRQLEHSNKLLLARRLTVLLEAAQAQVLFNGEPGRVAKRIANTRNHLTHRSKETRSRAAGPHGQVSLMWTVWLVLVAELLKEAGFEDELIKQRLGLDWRCRAIRKADLLADEDDEE